jgi:hypothetical protein
MPGIMTCTVDGMDAFIQEVRSLVPAIREAGGEELQREMVGVLEVSRQLVPYDTGRLSQSGRVDDPVSDGEVVSVYISYGGDNEVPYALIQHEVTSIPHKNGRQAKFLERPLLEWTRGGPFRLMTRVSNRVTRQVGVPVGVA